MTHYDIKIDELKICYVADVENLMKFGHYIDLNDKVVYVYFKVTNAVLYDKDRLAEVLELPTLLNLVFNNFTSIDLACDSTQNFTSLIKKMMRDKEVTTVINGNPKHLYRLEVRLHYQELKDYFARQYIVPTTEVILDGDLLTDMFLYHLGAVVRFTRGRRKILWQDLIGCNVRG